MSLTADKTFSPKCESLFKITPQELAPFNNGQIFEDPEVSAIQSFNCIVFFFQITHLTLFLDITKLENMF